MVSSILVSIFIGRVLGAEGLGIINLSNQITGILTMLVMLGLPTVILKETAIAFGNKNWERIQNIILTSLKINLPIAALVTILGYIFIPFIVENFFEDNLKIPLVIFTTTMIFQVISRVFGAGLNGYRKIWQSSLFGESLSMILVLLILLIQYFYNWQLSIISVAFSYAFSRVIVSIIITLYWRKVHHKVKSNLNKFNPRPLLRVGLPLLFIQATNNIANSIDSIMIGSFLSAKEVGLYAVAFRIAFVSSFLLQVTNAVLSPKVADLFANKQIHELEKIIQQVTGFLILIGIFGLLIVIFGGTLMLSIWGHEFSEAYYPLVILSIGQFFNIGTGCVALILTLCNEERILGYTTLSCAVLNTLLNVTFINIWGINGAAIATSTTMILFNIFNLYIVSKKLGIVTIPTKIFKI